MRCFTTFFEQKITHELRLCNVGTVRLILIKYVRLRFIHELINAERVESFDKLEEFVHGLASCAVPTPHTHFQSLQRSLLSIRIAIVRISFPSENPNKNTIVKEIGLKDRRSYHN